MAKSWQPWAGFRMRHPAIADGIAGAWSDMRPYLPPVNFITVHHAYFIFVGLLFAIIFWSISSSNVSFTDSLFLVQSAFTSSGLNTVNISELATGQQVILALMMILGSPVVISLFTIWFRAHIFEKRFEDIVENERNRRRKMKTGAIVGLAGALAGAQVMASTFNHMKPTRRDTLEQQQRAEADAIQLGQSKPVHESLQPIQESQKLEVDNSVTTARPQTGTSNVSNAERRRPFGSIDLTHQRPTTSNGGFDFKTFIGNNKQSVGRNGQFYDLTEEEREGLGGVEYRALKVLFVIVGVYFVVFQILGAIALGAWMSVYGTSIAAVSAQNPWWTGIFLAISSFNNAGMTLLDAGISAYNGDAFVLVVVILLALGGNYAFPAFIRLTVFVCSVILERTTAKDDPEYLPWKDALGFILKYPRRLFMLMFPAKANWTFVAICTSLGVINWALLLILSIGNSVLEVFPTAQRVGLALFQGFTIPSGGYTVVSASGLYFDVQVLWVLMMYVAAYPEIITMRNSNVYEERSLGIYTSSDDSNADQKSESGSSDGDTLPVTNAAAMMQPAGRPMSVSAMSHATSVQSIRRLAAVGRRTTAFVGKQVQKRVNNFNGVGVAPRPPPRRATEPVFNGPAVPVIAEEGHLDLVTQHLRSQLSHDVWFIAMALFLVTLIETSHSVGAPETYSVFNFLFEIVSGYTNIGLSIGLPGQSFSFCGGWYTGSKLVLVLMMVRGRHRGLPVALDHSVKLPGWDNVHKQQEDQEIRRSMNKSRASVDIAARS